MGRHEPWAALPVDILAIVMEALARADRSDLSGARLVCRYEYRRAAAQRNSLRIKSARPSRRPSMKLLATIRASFWRTLYFGHITYFQEPCI